MKALAMVISAFLLATGRPDLDFRSSLPMLVILAVFLYPALTIYGLPGVAVVLVIATLVACLYQIVLLLGAVACSPRHLVRSLRGGMVGSVPFAASWVILAVSSVSVPLIAALSMAVYIAVLAHALHGVMAGGGSGVAPASVRARS
jgi:hypothetical protein